MAAYSENGNVVLVANDKAAAGFKAAMSKFAKEAAALPPADTNVASK